ncbi:IclR family transcriptional regulator [Rhodovarius crocodyli]|uniref:IclR family transcriptional regulator n=1 Tax=Rhodovarius crocodyli TaxID=1979269 RepID=A0A437MGM5_9PROT|nr:IclR family transcriptional regulator [Rhodovarius crocodyli]RVT96755.1 IclR family transcriptional regulator [Rhodovarius crocodyli]
MEASRGGSLMLHKGLHVLRQVAFQGEIGVRELARHLGWSPTVVHRLVTSLHAEGFLEKDEASARYRVGAEAFEVGRAFLKSARLESCAPPVMRAIVEEGEYNAFLSVLRGSRVVYLSAMQDNGPINVRMSPGSEAPAHRTSMGKVMLAELPDEEILQKIHFHQQGRPGSEIDTVQLMDEIGLVRARGYAVADDEAFRGVVSVGVPIRDFSRKVLASMALSMPRAQMGEAGLERLTARAIEAGERISASLGARTG